MGAELSYLRPIDCTTASRSVSLHYHAPELREACALALTVLSGADPLFNGEVAEAEPHDGALFSVDLQMAGYASVEAAKNARVRSTSAMPLHGILKTPSDSLNVQIISVDLPQQSGAHLEAANSNTQAFFDDGFLDMLRQAIEAGLCQGRRRICFIETAQIDAESPSWVNFASRHLAETFSEIEIFSMTAADAAALMAADKFNHDIVVAEHISAEILRSLALTLTGTAGLAVSSIVTSEGLKVEPAPMSSNYKIDGSQTPILQMLAAGVEALVALKRYAAAGTVHNAILRALEDGVHPSSVRHIAPYSTTVSDADFVDAVIERFGSCRKNQDPVAYVNYRRQGREGGENRSPLRLVHSRDPL